MEHGICKQVLVGVGNLKARIKRLKVETLNRKDDMMSYMV